MFFFFDKFLWKTVLMTFLFVIGTSFVNGQNDYRNYHLNMVKSESVSDLDSVLHYKKEALKDAVPFAEDLTRVAYLYYKKNDLKNADSYFIEAFKYGFQIQEDIEYNILPYKIIYDNKFISQYRKAKNEYAKFICTLYDRNKRKLKGVRSSYLKKLNEIDNKTFELVLQNEYNFQEVRLQILPKKKLNDSTYKIVNKYLNTANSYLLLDLLKKGRFPDRRKCRRFNNGTITIVLNHAISSFANKEDANEFMTLLWQEVEKGNVTPYEYASIMDHFYHWYIDENITLLGTALKLEDDLKTFICKDVMYPEKLNSLREKYWLSTIEDFCRNTNFKLPKNYKR